MMSQQWLRPTAVLLATYIALMAAATFLLGPVWHNWDWAVFGRLSDMRAPAFASNVVVADLTEYDQRVPSRDRQTIANFLDAIRTHGQRPGGVLLDLYFESLCTSEDVKKCSTDPGTAALTRSLDAAAAAKPPIPVYATENPIGSQSGGGIDASYLSELDRDHVYDHVAAGHTILQLAASDGLFYQRCYRLDQKDSAGNVAGTQDIWALPYRVVKDAAGEQRPPCDDARSTEMEAVRLGPQTAFAQSVHPITLKKSFPDGIDFDGKYVIIATLEKDLGPLSKGTAPRSNPELLAWALSDLLESKNADAGYFQPLPANEMLLALLAGFTFITFVAFIAVFQGLRRLRLQMFREYLPWIAAWSAAGFALALFGAFEAWTFFAKQIQPQISLVGLSVLLAAGLCGERGRELLLEQSRSIDAEPDEANDYDVFISYAHDEFDWVYENVYVPFKDAKLSDGSKLSIFFDTSSLRIGSSWQDKISLAIDGSRFIVPIYSDTYFKRPYCRFEIKRAHRKWIGAGDNSRCVLPIMRGKPAILETVDDIQAASIDERPGLVAEVIAQIVEQIQAKPVVRQPDAAAETGATGPAGAVK